MERAIQTEISDTRGFLMEIYPYQCKPGDTALIIVDLQEAFQKAIPAFSAVADRVTILARGFSILGLPVIVTEQYPEKLGSTVAQVKKYCEPWNPVEKLTFAASETENFMIRLTGLTVSTVVLCGVESHVCICQTALGLLAKNYTVHVAADACASRKTCDHETAMRRVEKAGALPTTAEMCLFEMVYQAGTARFKEILQLVK
jgi:nicotinamidase-related amidase